MTLLFGGDTVQKLYLFSFSFFYMRCFNLTSCFHRRKLFPVGGNDTAVALVYCRYPGNVFNGEIKSILCFNIHLVMHILGSQVQLEGLVFH